jgi:hypothetical protein
MPCPYSRRTAHKLRSSHSFHLERLTITRWFANICEALLMKNARRILRAHPFILGNPKLVK